MDPLDFLKIAESLKRSPEEAGRRSAISRAYYAVFNHIRLYLEENRISVPDDSTAHEKIPRYLTNSGVQSAKEVGKNVDELKFERRAADYEMQLTGFSRNTCSLLVLKAQMTIQEFDSCKGRTLNRGIRNYLTRIGE